MKFENLIAAFMQWLNGSPSLNFVFLILAILGIAVAYIFYRKSKKEKLPVYYIKNTEIVKDELATINGLSITLYSQPIQALSLCRVAFWNNGHETIRGDDIADADPLRIELLSTGQVLSSRISFIRRDANRPVISHKSNSLYLNFDFLDYSDGVIIDIYHSGKGDNALRVAGVIKGAASLKCEKKEQEFVFNKFVDGVIGFMFFRGSGFFRRTVFVMVGLPVLILLLPFAFYSSASLLFSEIFSTIPKQYRL